MVKNDEGLDLQEIYVLKGLFNRSSYAFQVGERSLLKRGIGHRDGGVRAVAKSGFNFNEEKIK